jgi:O-antigen/teichoic acid export membrane protein
MPKNDCCRVKTLLERVLTSSLLRNITVLATGNIVAQFIPILMLPLFARIYAANMFGMQALLMVGVMFLVPLSTGFYEYAIPTPRSPRHARALATIAFMLSFAFNGLLLLLLLLFKQPISEIFRLQDLGDWIYAYPLLALSASVMSISNYWLLRKGKFYLQSVNKLCMAASTAAIVLAMGLAHIETGLTIGFAGGVSIGALYALWQARRQGLRFEFSAQRMYFLRLMRKYAEFPVFGSLPSSVNNLAAQVPIIIITAHYSLSMTGHYAVARNLLNGGVSLLAVCIGQVILKRFSDLIHAGESLWRHYCIIAGWILLIGVLGTAATYFIGPWFFHLYLGSGWNDSAEIVRILSLNILFWLLGPSLALAAIAIKKLRAIALWQMLHGLMAFGLILFSNRPFDEFIWCAVLFEAFSYALYFIIMTVTVWRYDQARKTA